MPTKLEPSIVRGSLVPVRAALEGSRGVMTPEEAQSLFSSCAFTALLIERLAQVVGEMLDSGVEGRKIAFLLKESLDAIEEWMELFDNIAATVARESPPFEGLEAGLSEVSRLIQSAQNLRSDFRELLRLTSTPYPKIDPNSLPPAATYSTLKDILDRLGRSGVFGIRMSDVG